MRVLYIHCLAWQVRFPNKSGVAYTSRNTQYFLRIYELCYLLRKVPLLPQMHVLHSLHYCTTNLTAVSTVWVWEFVVLGCVAAIIPVTCHRLGSVLIRVTETQHFKAETVVYDSLTPSYFFLLLCLSSSFFLKKHEALPLCLGKSAPTLVHPLDRAIFSHWTP
jgi:hypothetical protein